MFQQNLKASLCPLWQSHTHKNNFDLIYCLYKMKQSHWLLWIAKNCDWSRKITPLSNLTWALLLVEWKLAAKADWTAKSTNLKENFVKVKSVFVIGATLWAEKLGCCLEYCVEKNMLGKLVVAVKLEASRLEFWIKGATIIFRESEKSWILK